MTNSVLIWFGIGFSNCLKYSWNWTKMYVWTGLTIPIQLSV